MLKLDFLYASMNAAVNRNARNDAFPRAVCETSDRNLHQLQRPEQFIYITLLAMHNDNTPMSELFLVDGLRIHQRLVEKCPQCRSLVESDDAIVRQRTEH